jgi:hypothetical protein
MSQSNLPRVAVSASKRASSEKSNLRAALTAEWRDVAQKHNGVVTLYTLNTPSFANVTRKDADDVKRAIFDLVVKGVRFTGGARGTAFEKIGESKRQEEYGSREFDHPGKIDENFAFDDIPFIFWNSVNNAFVRVRDGKDPATLKQDVVEAVASSEYPYDVLKYFNRTLPKKVLAELGIPAQLKQLPSDVKNFDLNTRLETRFYDYQRNLHMVVGGRVRTNFYAILREALADGPLTVEKAKAIIEDERSYYSEPPPAGSLTKRLIYRFRGTRYDAADLKVLSQVSSLPKEKADRRAVVLLRQFSQQHQDMAMGPNYDDDYYGPVDPFKGSSILPEVDPVDLRLTEQWKADKEFDRVNAGGVQPLVQQPGKFFTWGDG